MLNQLLLQFARWIDAQHWSTALHESYYMYSWVETTHVLTLAVFLGMLIVIDLRMLGWAFVGVPASKIAERLNTPMMLGFLVMLVTGALLFYAIPVRTTQSVWFRLKVILLIVAGINALIFRNRMRAARGAWDLERKAPPRLRRQAGASLLLWAGVVLTGRAIAYDWYDCHKPQGAFMYWVAGCVDELQAMP